MTVPEATGARATLQSATAGDGSAFAIAGVLDADGAASLWDPAIAAIDAAAGDGTSAVVVDASGVEWCDGTGIALLVELDRRTVARGGTFELRGFPEEFAPLLTMFGGDAHDDRDDTEPPPGAIARLGANTLGFVAEMRELIGYVGKITLALLYAARTPHRIRWRETLRVAEDAGMRAAPVAMLIGFLIGVVMGFQSAMTLRQYGGEVFLGGLIGVSMVRILGPLLTAIVVTARSGSAFAAEIGTMTVNEEVDALRVMAVSPMQFLVVPRVIATIVMMPLLATFATFAGLFGGALVSVFALGLPLRVYTDDIGRWVQATDVNGALVKTLVYGLLVAAAGCVRGLQTSGGAVGVGRSTTRSVVTGIVLLAFAESTFSIVYYHLGI
jgi:phospholipid/cholesterol/gamma-HCH transport system permease protein